MYLFPNLEPVHLPCPILTDLHTHFSRVRYFHHFKKFPQFVFICKVKGFSIVNEANVDVFFLEFSCFFYDPMDMGNLISGCSPFSKSNLNIWKFSLQILLKPSLGNFEHYFTSL